MINDKRIKIRQPFRDQYTLSIDAEVNAIESTILSTVEIRYDFQVLNIKEDCVEVRLLVLESKVVKANNPMVNEVAQVSQVFGRMYNELHLQIEPSGRVLKVLNSDLILSKWRETKAEMEKHISGNEELEQAISLHDELFNNTDKVKIAVQANEFFAMYFGHVYDTDLPMAKKVFGTNIFNTANLEWSLNSESDPVLPAQGKEIVIIKTTSLPKLPLTDGFCNAAYHQFKDKIKVDPEQIKMFHTEERTVEYETGRLRRSSVSKIEEIDPEKLYHKFKFMMLSDSEKKIVEHGSNIEENGISGKEGNDEKIYGVRWT